MTLQSRASLLGRISSHLSCPVVAYVTGDRRGLETQVSGDQVPLFPRHLQALGKTDQLAVLLYTRGGDTNIPWSVVSFLREFCDELIVLVPFVAHSSGTLLALGADSVVMTRFATLSPIDPTVANAFNPQDPANPVSRFPIAVEDVLAFLELAKEQVDDDGYKQAFDGLAKAVHPLALGNVKRSINQIRQLAKKLIQLHPPTHSEEELTALITRLTTEFYSHQHLIGRREARELGLPVVDADATLEALLLSYYDELKTDLELLEPFNPAAVLRAAGGLAPAVAPVPLPPGVVQGFPPAAQPAPGVPAMIVVERGYIETPTTCDAFIARGAIAPQVVMTPAGAQQAIAFDVHSEKWERLA